MIFEPTYEQEAELRREMNRKYCPTCKGNKVVIVGIDAERDEVFEDTCPDCNGTGKRCQKMRCPRCATERQFIIFGNGGKCTECNYHVDEVNGERTFPTEATEITQGGSCRCDGGGCPWCQIYYGYEAEAIGILHRAWKNKRTYQEQCKYEFPEYDGTIHARGVGEGI